MYTIVEYSTSPLPEELCFTIIPKIRILNVVCWSHSSRRSMIGTKVLLKILEVVIILIQIVSTRMPYTSTCRVNAVHLNVSCHVRDWVISFYEWVMSHVWKRHITHICVYSNSCNAFVVVKLFYSSWFRPFSMQVDLRHFSYQTCRGVMQCVMRLCHVPCTHCSVYGFHLHRSNL